VTSLSEEGPSRYDFEVLNHCGRRVRRALPGLTNHLPHNMRTHSGELDHSGEIGFCCHWSIIPSHDDVALFDSRFFSGATGCQVHHRQMDAPCGGVVHLQDLYAEDRPLLAAAVE